MDRKIALARPYTFIVAAIVIILMTPIVLQRTPTDIFPNIDIPVISIAWNYTGLSPQQMEDRIVGPFERFLTTVVDNVEHTESQTVGGRSVTKTFFQPGTDVHVALTQVTAVSQSIIRGLPPRHRRAVDHHLLSLRSAHSAIGTKGSGTLRAGIVRLLDHDHP